MQMPGPPAMYAGMFSRMIDLGDEIFTDHVRGYPIDLLLDELMDASRDWVAMKDGLDG